MRKKYLLAPGPTPVPEVALLAMAQPAIHHRTPQFSEIFRETADLLKYVFQTNEDVLILAASGTGAMEGSIVNLFSPGDEVIVVNGGKFGERWGKISEAYGLKVNWITVEWGKAVEPSAVKKVLDEKPHVKGGGRVLGQRRDHQDVGALRLEGGDLGVVVAIGAGEGLRAEDLYPQLVQRGLHDVVAGLGEDVVVAVEHPGGLEVHEALRRPHRARDDLLLHERHAPDVVADVGDALGGGVRDRHHRHLRHLGDGVGRRRHGGERDRKSVV